MTIGNAFRIPHFITAATPIELQRLMLRQNAIDGVEHNYFSIQKDGTKWIAWFIRIADLSTQARKPK